MNKISKFLLSGAVVYSSGITEMLLKGKQSTADAFLLQKLPITNKFFLNTYFTLSELACKEFTGYKLGEAFSDQSLASKLIGSFVGGAVANSLIVNLQMFSQDVIISGLGSAALAYIWHEDSDTSELDQVSGGLSQSLQEDIPL